MAGDCVARGKATAMSVVMQYIHQNLPKFRYWRFACVRPENVDDYRMIQRAKRFA
jgi:hypothetical protein